MQSSVKNIIGMETFLEFRVKAWRMDTNVYEYFDAHLDEVEFAGTCEDHPRVDYGDGNSDQATRDVEVHTTSDMALAYWMIKVQLESHNPGWVLYESIHSIEEIINNHLAEWILDRVDDYLDDGEPDYVSQ